MSPHEWIRLTSGWRRLLLGAMCAGIALAGCGGSSTTTSSSSSTKTTAPSERPLTLALNLTVSNLLPGNILPTRYTCDGEDISPPLRWSGLPHGTGELALFILNFQPVHGRFFFDWAVAGLSPKLHGLAAGELPPGAVAGRNGFGRDGYSICPPKGGHETYAVKVIALPRKIPAQTGVDALTLYRDADSSATVLGLASVAYRRR